MTSSLAVERISGYVRHTPLLQPEVLERSL
jgi:hypothetical protein